MSDRSRDFFLLSDLAAAAPRLRWRRCGATSFEAWWGWRRRHTLVASAPPSNDVSVWVDEVLRCGTIDDARIDLLAREILVAAHDVATRRERRRRR